MHRNQFCPQQRDKTDVRIGPFHSSLHLCPLKSYLKDTLKEVDLVDSLADCLGIKLILPSSRVYQS